MNLVKAEEYAKGLPFPELKKYADGFNPSMIPPWLATGVMDAKTKLAQTANNLRGAATGPQASTKEQIEQKAGLMALQAAQKQQQQQAMMSQPAAGPVPENAPEANPQPEPEGETFMAARGGLTRLPSNLRFDGGGIVAFAGKGPSKVVNPNAGFWDWLENVAGVSKDDFINRTPQSTKNSLVEMFRSSENLAASSKAAAPAAQAATTAAQAAPAAAQAAAEGRGLMYGAGKLAGKATKALGPAGVLASTLAEAGDYKLKSEDDIDTSASGTFNDIRQGKFGRAAKGLGMGLAELGADLGSSVANTLDYVVPGKAPASSAYDKMLRDSGYFKDRPPAEGAAAPAETPKGSPIAATDPATIRSQLNASEAAMRPQIEAAPAPVGNAPKPNAGIAGGAGGAGGAPAANSLAALYRQALEGGPKERKIADLLAEQNEIRKGAGLGDEAGLAKLQRIKDIKDQFRATAPDALDDAIRVLGQAGQFKGLSGTSGAYTANQAQKRAQELAMSERINELMGGVEDTQRAEKTAVAGKVSEGRAKDLEQASQFSRDKLQSLGSTSASQYSADMHYKAAMAAMKNANIRQDMQEKKMLLDSFKTRIAAIDRELVPLEKSLMPADKALAEKYRAEKAGITKALDEASGISKIMPAPSAASPSGTTRVRFDAKGNQIK